MLTSFQLGRMAEEKATEYLVGKGYKIIARNWRNRWSEIDIIASRDTIIYFVEVKYRKSAFAGMGIDYIDSYKLNRMTNAANYFMARYKINQQYLMAVISVSGINMLIEDFLIVS